MEQRIEKRKREAFEEKKKKNIAARAEQLRAYNEREAKEELKRKEKEKFEREWAEMKEKFKKDDAKYR